jgi:flavin reductase (DIM6/NTAB) family NADH-FMN oxidoreductase RutF
MTAFDSRAFRDACGWFATGVAVITARAPDGAPVGFTANSFSSVSLDPPLVLFSLGRKAHCLSAFQQCAHFGINILAEHQQDVAARFATPLGEKWASLDHDVWDAGCPMLKEALAALECQVEAVHESGDHLVFIGRVLRLRAAGQGRPLLFCRGAYHALGERLGAPRPESASFDDAAEFVGVEPWFSA